MFDVSGQPGLVLGVVLFRLWLKDGQCVRFGRPLRVHLMRINVQASAGH
jgi:hypothetical protein